MPNRDTQVQKENLERRERVQGIGMTILAIAGFIIIIAIALWGTINAIRMAPDFLGTLGTPFSGSSKPALSISVSKNSVPSNEPVTVSWKASKPDEVGIYVFSFQCRPGFSFKMTPPGAKDAVALPCQTAVPLATTTSVTLTPVSANEPELQVGIAITSLSASGTRIADATTTITILNAEAKPATSTPSKPPAPEPKPTTPEPKPTPQPTGPADLSVRIIAVGVIEPQTGAFISRMPSSPQDIAAVQFDVANTGGGPSGQWTFDATLPTASGSSYRSTMQPSMGRGSHTVYTLKFNRAITGTFRVTVDPNNAVHESDESNNTATVSLQVTSSY